MTSLLSRLARPAGFEEILARLAIAVALLLSAADAVPAHTVKSGAITLIHPYVRATPPGAKVAGGFVTIHNGGAEADRLVGGTAEFAGRVEVHEMSMEGDVMKMRPVEGGIEIPAGGSLALKPGSFHLMFMDLAAPVKVGTPLKGTLVFEKAGVVQVDYMVHAIGDKSAEAMDQGAAAAGAMDHGSMNHGTGTEGH
jgi:copper(I)-binding protein